MINPIITATIKIPVHTPPLNIPPTTSQEAKTVVTRSTTMKVDIFFIKKLYWLNYCVDLDAIFFSVFFSCSFLASIWSGLSID